MIAVAAREQADQCAKVPMLKTDVVLRQLELALPDGLKHDVPAGLMYHYTHGEAGLEGILRSKVVWATQFEHLNDKEGITIILVTHDIGVARHTRRQIVMKDGLIEAGTISATAMST